MVVAIWYIFTEIGSIAENAEELGARVPKWLTAGIKKIQDKADNIEVLGIPVSEAEPGKHEKPVNDYQTLADQEGGTATLEAILEEFSDDD